MKLDGDRAQEIDDLTDRIRDAIREPDCRCPVRDGRCVDCTLRAVMRVVEPEMLRLEDDATERADTLAARLEEAEDRIRKAEQAYTELRRRADAAEDARARWQKRGEQAEATVERGRALAQAAKDAEAQSLSRQFGGAPWPASVPADDVLAALDARPVARGAQTTEETR